MKVLSPIISEKSMNEASKSKFTFKVSKDANKQDIKEEIEKRFKVDVLAVSTMNMKGKVKRAGTKRTQIKGSDWKKAIVRVKSGQKIDLFETAEKEG